jgi:hypothetical protein
VQDVADDLLVDLVGHGATGDGRERHAPDATSA